MVSRIPTFSIKTVLVRVKPEWVLPTLIFVGMFVAALSSEPWYTLLAVGVVYLASLPVGWVAAWRLRRRYEQAASRDDAPPDDADVQAGPARIVNLGWPRSDARPSKPDHG